MMRLISRLGARLSGAGGGRSGSGGEGRRREALRYEQAVLPHIGAAYNLARWLVRSDHDAEDIVQDACVRAFTHLDSLRGDDGRSWLLAIVRNACYTHLRRDRETLSYDDGIADVLVDDDDPADLVLRTWEGQRVRAAVEALPAQLREVVVLREIEELSYREIAAIADVPLGTVMSRLSRARGRLARALGEERGRA